MWDNTNMTINIKYTGLDSTPAMNEYVNEKLGALEKFVKRMDDKGAVKVFVEIARTTKHHNKGDVHMVTCNLELPGKLFHAESENWDVRLGVDEVRDILENDIKKYLEKFRPQDSGGQKKLRELRGKE